MKNLIYAVKIFFYSQFYGCNFLFRGLPVIGVLFLPLQITGLFALKKRKGERLRSLFIKLGPTFIKFGQLLSTRNDLVGVEISHDLSVLQDRLPAFSFAKAKKILESELGDRIENIFSSIEEKPVAAASISQVHKAVLKNGDVVAIKILRPKIVRKFMAELNFLYFAARIINFFKIAKRLKLKETIKIFKEVTKKELDFRLEAASASEAKENLASSVDKVYIPKIYWQLVTKKILCSEWLEGVKITDIERIKEQGHNLEKLASNLLECYFNQAYRDGFFHADMHPGNVFVLADGRISFVDFGIMGHLIKKERLYITQIMHGFVQKDFDRVAKLHLLAGYVPANTNVKDFSLACRSIASPIFDLPSEKMSIAKMLAHLFSVTESFGMETQPQLLLLQKTLLIVEGVARKLNPKINIWLEAEPWMREWAKENMNNCAIIKDKLEECKDSIHKFPLLLEKLFKLLDR